MLHIRVRVSVHWRNAHGLRFVENCVPVEHAMFCFQIVKIMLPQTFSVVEFVDGQFCSSGSRFVRVAQLVIPEGKIGIFVLERGDPVEILKS